MSIYGHELNVYNFDFDEINSINEAIINESEETKNILNSLGKQLLKSGFKGVGKILKVIGIVVGLNAALAGILMMGGKKDEKASKNLIDKINSDPKLKKQLQDAIALSQNYILDNAKEKKYISKKEFKLEQNQIHLRNKKTVVANFNILDINIDQLFKDITKEDWEKVAYKIAKEKYKDDYIDYWQQGEETFFDNIGEFFDKFPDDYGMVPFTGKYKEVKDKINEYTKSIVSCINNIPFSSIKDVSMNCYVQYVNQDSFDDDGEKISEVHYFDDFYNNRGTISLFLAIKFSNN